MAMHVLMSNSPHIGNPALVSNELPTMRFVTRVRISRIWATFVIVGKAVEITGGDQFVKRDGSASRIVQVRVG